ncbi:MAG: CpsD/CapB family tyrosine-protein kinase [Candidatus Rokuibacteriota bacterium]
MSKFFKALENAEREREAGGAAVPVDTGDADAGGAEIPPPPVPPARAGGRVTVTAPIVPAVGAEAPTAPDAPPPARPGRLPVYGAPLVRERAAYGRVFEGTLPPAAGEPGELDDHLVSLLEPTSLAAERYRTVRLHIETLRRERDLRLVAVSSPSRGDGRTVSAINLAGALAQAPDARVALVEVDVRHPGMARYLGIPPHRGLSTYLLDAGLSVDDVLQRPSGVGVAVVVAGPVSSMPYELLTSPRLGALLADLRQRFDFVVVDTPPVLPFPDVGIVRDLVDGFLLVVRANRTPREMVRDSLAAVGADRVLGLVFNDDERSAAAGPRAADESGWRAVLPRPRGGVRAA